MKLRTLIVDDEPLARERLRQLLESSPEIEIVGECGDGLSAVEAVDALAPDLLFLDVQMPELDGFGVLAAIPDERLPVVIFVTAYDEFAVKAFEVHAADYLLKPYDRERFALALRRALERARQRRGSADLRQHLSAMLADLKPATRPVERLAVKTEGRVVLLRPEEIDWVEASDNYVNLHVGQESYLLRETMNAMEARLPGGKFLRISRSTIVNVDRVRELQPMFHGEYCVILRNGARLTLSRSHRDKLPQLGLS